MSLPRNRQSITAGKAPLHHETVAEGVKRWLREVAEQPVPEHKHNLVNYSYLLDEYPYHLPTPEERVSWAAKGILRAQNGTRLSISYLPATSLPEAIGRLTQLQNLSLHSTECIELPDSIGDLANLGFLKMSTNPRQVAVSSSP
jgi:hypothetical protein